MALPPLQAAEGKVQQGVRPNGVKEETDMAENDKLDAVSLGDGRYKCPCGYVYDPAKGDPKHDIPVGTKFEDLPDDWRCPRCKRKKEKFKAL